MNDDVVELLGYSGIVRHNCHRYILTLVFYLGTLSWNSRACGGTVRHDCDQCTLEENKRRHSPCTLRQIICLASVARGGILEYVQNLPATGLTGSQSLLLCQRLRPARSYEDTDDIR